MPHSSPDGKDWLRSQITALQPATVLDIGAGAGTYAGLLRPALLDACHITGIEIWAPYIKLFDLTAKYDKVIVGDVIEMAELPAADVVVLGDVLEHMAHDQAVAVWDKARKAAKKAVFLSIPIVEYPQGPSHDNPWETHVHTWTAEMVLEDLPGIVEAVTYGEIGVCRARPA